MCSRAWPVPDYQTGNDVDSDSPRSNRLQGHSAIGPSVDQHAANVGWVTSPGSARPLGPVWAVCVHGNLALVPTSCPEQTGAEVWSPGSGASGEQAGRKALRVLVVQNHMLLASALARILEGDSGLSVCGIARTGAEGAQIAAREKPGVVLMDFSLPDMSGPAAAAMIHIEVPGVSIVFHSTEDSEVAVLDAIDAGATAYLAKSATAAQIVDAVKRAGTGEVLIPVSLFAKAIARRRKVLISQDDRQRIAAQFTARELDVLRLLAEGLDTIAMSRRLGIAAHTIEWHVRHVIEKLQVHSKLQAVIAAARLGLIDVAKS